MTSKSDGNSEIKYSLSELRKTLAESKSDRHKIRFKSYGRKYVITNDDNNMGDKLEKSFNSFMNKLKVDAKGKRLRGICFVDKKSDSFSVGYQKEGEFVLHQIRGRLG